MSAKKERTFRTLLASGPTWVALAIIAVNWIAITVMLGNERQRALDAAMVETAKLTIALHGHASEILTELDRTLKLARKRLDLSSSSEEVLGLLKQSELIDQQVELLAVVDMNGYVIASSAKADGLKIYVGDREHVAAHFTNQEDIAILGKPVISRLSSQWLLPMTRKLYDKSGKFSGVVVAGWSPKRTSEYYSSLISTNGAQVALIGFDGFYRARGNLTNSQIGGTVNDSRLLADARQSKANTLVEPANEHFPALIRSHRVVEPFPVFVSATIPTSDVLSAYFVHERIAYLFGGAMTVVIALFAILILSSRHQQALTIGELKANDKLLAAKSRYLSIALDHMARGLMLVDSQGMVRIINRRAVDLMGLPHRFLSENLPFSQIVADLMARDDFGDALAMRESGLRQAIDFETSSSIPISYVRRRKDGRYIEVESEPLPEGGFVRFFSDMTQMRRQEEDMTASARNLDRFAQIAMRDLQQPLYDISSQLLRLSEAFDERDRSYGDRAISHLSKAAQTGRDIANDLVCYTQQCVRILDARPASLNDIIMHAIARVRRRCPDEAIDFASSLPRITINCDLDVIGSVFDSLFVNALSFRNGMLPLEIRIYGQFCPQTDNYQIHIRDTGSGFMSTEQERIFEPFARLMGETGYIDMGIDLALAQVGVEKHGWTITGSSVIDMGSTFIIEVPRRDLIEIEGVQQGGSGQMPLPLSAAA